MATTTNFGWETPDDTDLVKDGALAIRTLGSAIDTSLVDLKGGTTGQVLSKTSNTDMDFTWVTSDDANAIQNSIIDAKGDLIVGSSNDNPARLAVGTNDYVLTADSAATYGVKWAAAPTPSYTWTSYTPTLTNLTTGNGTLNAKFLKVGKVVFVRFSFVFGSTSSISGGVEITLPSGSTSANASWAVASLVDAGTATFTGVVQTSVSDTKFYLYANNASSTYSYTSNTSSTVPFTWTTNDQINFFIGYEEA